LSSEETAEIARRLLSDIGSGREPDRIALLFSKDVRFEIPGDIGALPWIGQANGRGAVSEFIHGTRTLIERVKFDVHGILVDNDRAVIFGDLASKFLATGRMVESPFAMILTISEGKITRFQMLEDTFAVSRASRP